MIQATDFSAVLATDPNAVARGMRARSKSDADGGLKAAAQQFEAIFLDLMLKNMRAAKLADSEFDGVGTREFTGMLDQQMSSKLSQRGGLGLAELMLRQLSPRDSSTALPVKKSAHLP